MVNKGTVSAILNGGKIVTVKPYTGEIVTVELVVPFFLVGCLAVEMPVIYVTFEDNTGIVLSRMDGEWSHNISGPVTVAEIVTAQDFKTASAAFSTHTHNCPEGQTGSPN